MIDISLDGIGGLLTSAREAITGKKVIDPNELAKLDLQLAQLQESVNQGQVAINKIEAASTNLFVAGWRPFIGWVCGISLTYAFIGEPITEWIIAINDLDIITPELETDKLIDLVIAMLGLAGLRTYEKTKKVSREK